MRLPRVAKYGILLLLAVLAAFLYAGLMPYALPTASLRARVFAPGARRTAEQFLHREQIAIPADYRCSVYFITQNKVKAYVEQTLGIWEANRVLQSDGLVYYWVVRWFSPGKNDCYLVRVSPDGAILGYRYNLANDAPAAETKDAKQVARDFALRTAGLRLAGYKQISSALIPQARRNDYSYTWERRNFTVGDAVQRVRIIVTGSRVISFQRYVSVPDAFLDGLERETKRGDLLANASFCLSLIFYLAALVAVIRGIITGAFHWQSGFWAAVLVTLVNLLNALNELPLAYADFEVSYSWPAYWTSHGTEIGLRLLATFLTTMLVVCGAEWYYRRTFPQHRPLYWWFTRAGLASDEGRKNLLFGYWLIPIQLAFVCVFYLLAEGCLHAWMPADIPYDNLFSTRAPWAYALLVGVEASVSEEFLFRVLAISWLKRVVKWEWLAITIPALVWGFGHCNYPNQPFYIRGIELTLWGIIFGYIFVRSGPLPSLIAHAGYNIAIAGTSFLTSITAAPRMNALVVLVLMLLPLALAVWFRRKREAAPDETPADNQALTDLMLRQRRERQQSVPLPETEPPPRPLPHLAWWLSGVFLLVALAICLADAFTTHRLTGSTPSYNWEKTNTNPFHGMLIDRTATIRIARAAVKQKKAAVDGWVMSAVSQTGDEDAELVHDYLGDYLADDDRDALKARLLTPELMWSVCWQKPLSAERWEVRLAADGTLWDIDHTLPENAPVIQLTSDQALGFAERALTLQGAPINHLQLAGVDYRNQPDGSSYQFSWTMLGLQIGNAQYLTEVKVTGNQVGAIERKFKVPDSYAFQQETENLRSIISEKLALLLFIVPAIWACILCIATLRRYRLPWRWGAGAAVAMALILLAYSVMKYPRDWADLTATESPLGLLLQTWLLNLAVMLLAAFFAFFCLPLLMAMWASAFPDLPGPRTWLSAILRPYRHRDTWRSALLAQVPIASLLLLVVAVMAMLDAIPSDGLSTDVQIPHWLVHAPALVASLTPGHFLPIFAGQDLLLPVFFRIGAAIVLGLVGMLAWLALVAFGKRIFRKAAYAVCCAGIFLALVVTATDDTRIEIMLTSLECLIIVTGLWALYRLVLRAQPLAIFVTIATAVLAVNAENFLWFPAYRLAGITIGIALIAVYGWAFLTSALARGRPAPIPVDEALVDMPEPGDGSPLEQLADALSGEEASASDKPTAENVPS